MAKKTFVVAPGRSVTVKPATKLTPAVVKSAGDRVSLEAADGEDLVAQGFLLPASAAVKSAARSGGSAAAKTGAGKKSTDTDQDDTDQGDTDQDDTDQGDSDQDDTDQGDSDQDDAGDGAGTLV